MVWRQPVREKTDIQRESHNTRQRDRQRDRRKERHSKREPHQKEGGTDRETERKRERRKDRQGVETSKPDKQYDDQSHSDNMIIRMRQS